MLRVIQITPQENYFISSIYSFQFGLLILSYWRGTLWWTWDYHLKSWNSVLLLWWKWNVIKTYF